MIAGRGYTQGEVEHFNNIFKSLQADTEISKDSVAFRDIASVKEQDQSSSYLKKLFAQLSKKKKRDQVKDEEEDEEMADQEEEGDDQSKDDNDRLF